MAVHEMRASLPGGNSEREPPDPISNSEVKTFCADGSVGPPHVRVGHRQALISKSRSRWERLFIVRCYTARMRFAEVFLRLGVALVSWMIIYAHTLWLAVLSKITCGPDGSEMHALLLGIAPITAVAVLMTRATQTLADIHRLLRWFGIPVFLLVPWCLASIWQVATLVNFGNAGICASVTQSAWETWWAPIQIVLLLLLIFVLAINFRKAPRVNNN